MSWITLKSVEHFGGLDRSARRTMRVEGETTADSCWACVLGSVVSQAIAARSADSDRSHRSDAECVCDHLERVLGARPREQRK